MKSKSTNNNELEQMFDIAHSFGKLEAAQENMIEISKFILDIYEGKKIIPQRIQWYGSKKQLLNLFLLLKKFNLIQDLKQEAFITHFVDKNNKLYSTFDKIALKWIGDKYLLAVLVNELLDKKLIPKVYEVIKYQLLSNHFADVNIHSLPKQYHKRKTLKPKPKQFIELSKAIQSL